MAQLCVGTILTHARLQIDTFYFFCVSLFNPLNLRRLSSAVLPSPPPRLPSMHRLAHTGEAAFEKEQIYKEREQVSRAGVRAN